MPHILLVEDDSDIMRINRTFLETEGYAVHCADSVQTATFMLEECVPDLVLLDVMLPDGDGMDFCKILRQKRNISVPFKTPLMVHGNISAYGIKPCFERAFAVESRLFYSKFYKCVLNTILSRADIISITAQIQHETVPEFMNELDHAIVIACKETAVATFTVIHVCDSFRV